MNARFLSPTFFTQQWNAHQMEKKKRREKPVPLKPAVSNSVDRMRVTSWYFSSRYQVSEACFLFEMLLFISCYRYSSLVRVWQMCVNKWGMATLSHFISHTFLLRVLRQSRASGPTKSGGKAGPRVGGWGGARWDAGCWGADRAELFCGPDFICETRARVDHRPAGRPTCCSCPGNTQQWSMGIYRHQLNLSPFLPPPLWFLTLPLSQTLFILHFLFSFPPFLNKTWPPACCWCHGCRSNRSLTATSQLGWGQGER